MGRVRPRFVTAADTNGLRGRCGRASRVPARYDSDVMERTDGGRPILIVAAVTPLGDEGAAVDEAAIRPYVEFLESHGADGVFACGTTGEGVLLSGD